MRVGFHIRLHVLCASPYKIACFMHVFSSAIQIPTTINIFKDIIPQTLLTIAIFCSFENPNRKHIISPLHANTTTLHHHLLGIPTWIFCLCQGLKLKTERRSWKTETIPPLAVSKPLPYFRHRLQYQFQEIRIVFPTGTIKSRTGQRSCSCPQRQAVSIRDSLRR